MAESYRGGYWKFEITGVPLANPEKEREINALKREKARLHKRLYKDLRLNWQDVRYTREYDRVQQINRDIRSLREAKYQDTDAKALEGYFVAGNHVQKIKIALANCTPQRVRDGFGDTICEIVDYETTGTAVFHWRDGLAPGTKVIFGDGEDETGFRRWFVMPTSDAEVVGWFIRGPDYVVDDDLL
jgi:hypothetical protein